MITEMVVVEMDIRVEYHGHMVGVDVVEVHITAAEEVATMRGKILVMIRPPNGIQVINLGMTAGAIFQVLKFKIQQVEKLFQGVGVVVKVEVEAVGVVGVEEQVAVIVVVGEVVAVMTKILDGVVLPRKVLMAVGLVAVVGGRSYENSVGLQLEAGTGVMEAGLQSYIYIGLVVVKLAEKVASAFAMLKSFSDHNFKNFVLLHLDGMEWHCYHFALCCLLL